jgi:mono/diheme cytochrome c family protein
MQRTKWIVCGAAGVLAAAGLGLGAFVGSGAYNIGADDHHTRVVLELITALRERSIEVRARSLELPPLEDEARIAAGAHRYAQLCAACHMAPGAGGAPLRAGLYPHPPNLSQEAAPDPRRAFWVIKHGIKMSAMPAWGRTLDDAALWDIVAFLGRQPRMSPADYQRAAQ